MSFLDLPFEIILQFAKTSRPCDARNLFLAYGLSDKGTMSELKKLGMHMPVTNLKIPCMYEEQLLEYRRCSAEARRDLLSIIESLDQRKRRCHFLTTLTQLLGGTVKKLHHVSDKEVCGFLDDIVQYLGSDGENVSLDGVICSYTKVMISLSDHKNDEIEYLLEKIGDHLWGLFFRW